MPSPKKYNITLDKKALYTEALRAIDATLDGEQQAIAKMATISCLLKQHLPYYFWVGFYCVHEQALLIGPYQGTLGCLHISFERGVCGRAARTQQTQIVDDVHADPTHIACDPNSQSEIVVPVHDAAGKLIAVLDVDSTEKGSFDAIDQAFLEELVQRHFAHTPLQTHYSF